MLLEKTQDILMIAKTQYADLVLEASVQDRIGNFDNYCELMKKADKIDLYLHTLEGKCPLTLDEENCLVDCLVQLVDIDLNTIACAGTGIGFMAIGSSNTKCSVFKVS